MRGIEHDFDRRDPPAVHAGHQALRQDGTQANVVNLMQTRAELYEHLNYHSYEQKLDALFKGEK